MNCPELDPVNIGYYRKTETYIRRLLIACSEFNIDGSITDNLGQFIQDWQKVHGKMTFRCVISLGSHVLNDKDYLDFRCLESYIEGCWNDFAYKYDMKPTTVQEIKSSFELPDLARFKTKPTTTLTSSPPTTGTIFSLKNLLHADKIKIIYSPVVIAAILIASALLIAAYIMRPNNPRYKVMSSNTVLDSETGEVLWAQPKIK